ncbi:TetR/AcrR family transcriptional regulator [Chitinophaga sp. Cy-1792]|uniref:TetR/AcrR family transcriptional regulator n=1 Tax=Chitinophaga sp. Cy-1792 TaxID=2608339 RepID=UPI00141E445B|nr:TetR/AcrR family transcriptional regulator [Chitinophaga sp. Cy-1792]NIG54383.1 TetR/AcrR family transcriptional regulator [Chitinophaga sp. Cy-1792]
MRYRDEDKIQRIKEKAIEMIAKEGYENFGINRLAKAAGVSPATIYIYYKDKDDLIANIVSEASDGMVQAIFHDFDPEASFEEGLWKQWKNRASYCLKEPLLNCFMERMRNTDIGNIQQVQINNQMKEYSAAFMSKAYERGELTRMSLEVYWSVAFAPLYTLIRFHQQGKSFDRRPFQLTDDILREAFDRVIKSFK